MYYHITIFNSGIDVPLVDDPENFNAQGWALDVSKPNVKSPIIMSGAFKGPISQKLKTTT